MQNARMRWIPLRTVSLLIVVTMTGARGGDGRSFSATGTGIRSLAPMEVLASDLRDPSGVATERSGAILVVDRGDGTLTRIDPSGRRRTLLDNLHRPGGVAVDPADCALVLDAGGSRVLRRCPDGSLSVVNSALQRAKAIAVGPDGRTWIAMRGTATDQDDDDGSGKGRGSEYVIARLEESGTLTSFASGFIDVQGVAADRGALYVAMARLAAERGPGRTAVVRVPIRADGTAGPAEPFLRNMGPRRVQAVAVDAAGDVFITVAANTKDDGPGIILKRPANGQAMTFASGLHDPDALAFGQNGDLVVVERNQRGRLLCFRAPPPPHVAAPAFTNQTPLAVNGNATAGTRVSVGLGSDSPVLQHTLADAITGVFALKVPLELNASNNLSAVATGSGGAGLVSAATNVRVVHDDYPPGIRFVQPVAGAHVRDVVTLRASGEDAGSGVTSIVFSLDDSVAAVAHNAQPPEPLVAEAALDTRIVSEGPHTLTVIATDRAGNSSAAAQLLVVDRTAPDTEILTGPPRETAERTAIFTFSGADVQSANLDFAWRLDGSLWSAFSASPVIELTSMTPGLHRFEVKARDRAGNEDPTPAAQTFTVTALRIRILEPAPGAVITTETIWVRGIVESGARDVTVTIPLPPELRNELSLEVLPAATEAGTFAAEVPATPSMTTVTVIARDSEGATSTDAVSVGVQSPLSGSTRFEAFPASGFAPHAARFSEDAFPPGSFYSLDLESDGTIDYEGDTLSDREFLYARPGIHVAMLQVTSPDGQMFTARTSVDVYDRATLDARLQAAWRGFKEALRGGDVARAATFVHRGRRAAWEEYFRQLTPGVLAATDTVFADVTLLEIEPGRAECEMMRDVDGLLYSFPISFLIDVDGGWRLWQF